MCEALLPGIGTVKALEREIYRAWHPEIESFGDPEAHRRRFSSGLVQEDQQAEATVAASRRKVERSMGACRDYLKTLIRPVTRFIRSKRVRENEQGGIRALQWLDEGLCLAALDHDSQRTGYNTKGFYQRLVCSQLTRRLLHSPIDSLTETVGIEGGGPHPQSIAAE
uniref:Uncharacterized protein n=1 Tax=Rhizochromulina marina TaxID=1034831 RepID=A0A7S2WFD2_9STRA